MSFAALIAVFEGENGAIPALRVLAGASLVERQARLALGAGAERVVVIGDALAPALAHEVARLRAQGLAVTAVSGLGDAADLVGSAARVLVLADGCLPDRALIERLAAAPVPALATIDDEPAFERFERIDGEARWAGAALLDGRRVSETAAMVGEWDPVSTLLRRAVQEHATRIAAALPPLFMPDGDELGDAEAALLAAARPRPRGWADRWIEQPIADLAAPWLLARRIDAAPLGWGAVGLGALAALLALAGWRWPPLLALLAAGPLGATAARIAALGARPPRRATAARAVRLGAMALAALGLGRGLASGTGQWGWLAVALALLAAMGALGFVRRLLGRVDSGETEERVWLAHAEALPWALTPFAIAGQWGAGLAALTLYALASLGERAMRLDGAIEPRSPLPLAGGVGGGDVI